MWYTETCSSVCKELMHKVLNTRRTPAGDSLPSANVRYRFLPFLVGEVNWESSQHGVSSGWMNSMNTRYDVALIEIGRAA